jgi:hypothetical protein
MTQHPDGNFTKYLKTKSEECADNNRTLLTIAHDGSVSFIKMKPMAAVLLYPDQVMEFLNLMNKYYPYNSPIKNEVQIQSTEVQKEPTK